MEKNNMQYLIPQAWILLSDPQVNMMVFVCVPSRWEMGTLWDAGECLWRWKHHLL